MAVVELHDIKFYHVKGKDAQQFFCNYCGVPGFTENWFKANIPFADGEANFKIVICSDECLKKFKENKDNKTVNMLNDSIAEMERVHTARKATKMPMHGSEVN